MYVTGITTGFNTISIYNFVFCFLLLFKCHFKSYPYFWEIKKMNRRGKKTSAKKPSNDNENETKYECIGQTLAQT